VALAVAAAAFFVFAWTDLGRAGTDELPGLTVGLKVKKDGKDRLIEKEKIEIAFEMVTLPDGKRIEEALRQRGIFPDAEALAVVYAANPTVTAAAFRSGARVRLPRVRGGKQLQNDLAQGYLVELTLDSNQKTAFVKTAEATPSLAAKFAALDVTHFSNTDAQEIATRLVSRGAELIQGFRTVVRDRTAALAPGTADALNGEAELFNEIVERSLRPGAMLGADDLTRIKLVVQDLEVRAESLRQKKGAGQSLPRYRDVRVTVKTQKADGAPVHKLYVYYAPVALKDKPAHVLSFDGVTSPVSQMIGEANYFVWAEPPPTPRTKPMPQAYGKEVHVRKIEGVTEIVVELVVP
jgi:hypothetical protein